MSIFIDVDVIDMLLLLIMDELFSMVDLYEDCVMVLFGMLFEEVDCKLIFGMIV